ncbi:MAG: hypothetical protein WBB36_15335, partial [Chitinophagales bacterium]
MFKRVGQDGKKNLFGNRTGRQMTTLMHIALTAFIGVVLLGCLRSSHNVQNDEVSIALEWNQFILKAEINTEGYR